MHGSPVDLEEATSLVFAVTQTRAASIAQADARGTGHSAVLPHATSAIQSGACCALCAGCTAAQTDTTCPKAAKHRTASVSLVLWDGQVISVNMSETRQQQRC